MHVCRRWQKKKKSHNLHPPCIHALCNLILQLFPPTGKVLFPPPESRTTLDLIQPIECSRHVSVPISSLGLKRPWMPLPSIPWSFVQPPGEQTQARLLGKERPHRTELSCVSWGHPTPASPQLSQQRTADNDWARGNQNRLAGSSQSCQPGDLWAK